MVVRASPSFSVYANTDTLILISNNIFFVSALRISSVGQVGHKRHSSSPESKIRNSITSSSRGNELTGSTDFLNFLFF